MAITPSPQDCLVRRANPSQEVGIDSPFLRLSDAIDTPDHERNENIQLGAGGREMTFQAVALIVTLVAATPNNDLPPNAVESVWMKAETVITESRKMKAKGMMPASIDCRIDSISGTAAVYSMKIVWVPNDAGIIWRFGVGTAEENFKLEEGNRASGIRNVWSKQLIDKASGWPRLVCALGGAWLQTKCRMPLRSA
ncbi:hypothetical protein NKH45_08370 [Mesorhizobium sp. M1156]|uniref:hypothetical protein n=1 Tax=unclassified Mesorhizobium TaxID=325217 RepID=UPI00333B4204